MLAIQSSIQKANKMDTKDIVIRSNNSLRSVTISYNPESPCIHLTLDNSTYSFYGENLYSCFVKLRCALPDIKFLCKGAKINVHPSRASSQMSAGLMAYELTLGKQALRANLVNIFDYEENDLTNNPLTQSEFFEQWINSLK